jgi:hypothetical protein
MLHTLLGGMARIKKKRSLCYVIDELLKQGRDIRLYSRLTKHFDGAPLAGLAINKKQLKWALRHGQQVLHFRSEYLEHCSDHI